MPRKARKYSITGFYHIVLCGIDKSLLFQCDDDKSYFLNKLIEKRFEDSQFEDSEIHAYCLMDNHVHLVIYSQDISNYIKRVAISYASYFNKRYCRSGPLFENRFFSEAIEDESYFQQCIRYVFQNPVKAGICKSISQYTWSSFRHYFDNVGEEVELSLIKRLFPTQDLYETYMNSFSDVIFKDVIIKRRMEDNELRKMISDLKEDMKIQNFSKSDLYKIIQKVREHVLTSNAQMARVMGISLRQVKKNGKCS